MERFPSSPKRGATLTELLLVLGVLGFLTYKGLKNYSKTHVPAPTVFEMGTLIQNIEGPSLIKPLWGSKLTALCPQVEDSKIRPTGPAMMDISKKIASTLGANPQTVVDILGDPTVYSQAGQLRRRIIVGGRVVAGLSTKPAEDYDQFQSVRQFEGYLVVRADGTNFRVNLHGQPATVHLWRNPATGLYATVFFTYSSATIRLGEQAPSGLIVEQDAWKGDFHLDNCVDAHEPGVPAAASASSKCLTGIVTDPKGVKMPLTYGYIIDWASRKGTRIVMGGEQMVPVTP